MIGSASRFHVGLVLEAGIANHRAAAIRLGKVPLREIFSAPRMAWGTPLVLYLLVMQAAVQISGPYFAPYMLAQQKAQLHQLHGAGGHRLFGKSNRVAAVGPRGSLRRRAEVAVDWRHVHCARRSTLAGGRFFAAWKTSYTLQVGSLTIPCEFSAEFIYLAWCSSFRALFGRLMTGHAAHVFRSYSPSRRACVLTLYNFGNAAAHVVGGLIGAAILQFGGESHSAYLALFGISSLVRLSTVPLLRSANYQPPHARDEHFGPATSSARNS